MLNLNKTQPLVLLVDDNTMDNELSQLAINAIDPSIQTKTFLDGRDVLAYLKQQSPSDPLPGLMILDVNMPLVGGFEVLARLQHSPLKQFPIIIMSSSSLPEDQERARQLGAADACAKPYGYLETIELYRKIFKRFLVSTSM